MIREIYSQIYRSSLVLMTWPGELGVMLIYPFIGLITLGLFGSFALQGGVGSDAFIFLIYGVFSWSVYSVGQQSTTRGFLYEIWDHVVKNLFATRIRLKEFVLGNVIFALMSVAIMTTIYVILCWLMFGFNLFAVGPLLIVGMAGILFEAIAESLIIMSLLFKGGQKFGSISWIIPGIIMIFCGVYYPISALPESVQVISNLLPATHAIAGIRNLTLNQSLAMTNLTTAIIHGVIYLAIAISILKYTSYLSKKDGSLAKFVD